MEYTTTVSVFKLIDDVWTPQFDAQWLLMVFRKEVTREYHKIHIYSIYFVLLYILPISYWFYVFISP